MTESRYRTASAMVARRDESLLGLETALGATPQGLVEHPRFFSGMLARPQVTAAGVLAVADVAGTRYFDAGTAQRVASLDPVVTASGDRLRFESFSLCNGVHARLDLLADGIDSGEVAHGTTNVDVNQPLRVALAGLGGSDLVHLDVGTDGITVATLDETLAERKVDLPDRWVRGFAETPVLASGMELRAELTGPTAARWLAALPRAVPGPSYHLVPTPAGFRQSVRPAPGSLHVAGAGRLAASARVARFAERVLVFGSEAAASAWVFELPGARLTLLLSPESYRGFSGEGGLLTALTDETGESAASLLLEHLAWEPVIDRAALAGATGLSPAGVDAGINRLAVSGKVGFDLAEGTWFHRELPRDDERVERDNPRLRDARRLVAEGAVLRDGDRWAVTSGGHRHWVTPDGAAYRCSCLWWAKYGGRRGACKHVLAVTLSP
jgi:SWIM zinc finger